MVLEAPTYAGGQQYSIGVGAFVIFVCVINLSECVSLYMCMKS
jgi:hypothetical protein